MNKEQVEQARRMIEHHTARIRNLEENEARGITPWEPREEAIARHEKCRREWEVLLARLEVLSWDGR